VALERPIRREVLQVGCSSLLAVGLPDVLAGVAISALYSAV
jgi:hypothetical protein